MCIYWLTRVLEARKYSDLSLKRLQTHRRHDRPLGLGVEARRGLAQRANVAALC